MAKSAGNCNRFWPAIILSIVWASSILRRRASCCAHDPDTVRAPDIAFIRKDHVPREKPKEAYWPGAPDLAVEVVSPGDTVSEVDEKVQEWLDAGAMMVWVVKPRSRSVIVYRSATDVKILTEKDDLSGEDVLPGFRCGVREIFESGLGD